jgi:hypothetical protein
LLGLINQVPYSLEGLRQVSVLRPCCEATSVINVELIALQ